MVKSKKSGYKRIPRTKMTSQEATSFDAESTNSYTQVLEALERRREESDRYSECSCEPYEDVFTFERWIAQGKVVKRGEKALAIQSWIVTPPSKEEQEKDPEAKPRMRPKVLHLFCRCQVKELEKKGGDIK